MHTGEPKPPRFNRYHAYLIVGVLVIFPLIASRRIRGACGDALYGWGAMHLCTEGQAWQWVLSTGGSWEIWLRAAFAAALLGAIIYSAFK